MSRIPSVFDSTASEQKFSSADAINDLDLNTFLELMIAELQNQDPLNPLDNKDMLAQISQIREVGATDKLTKTLESVLLGQNISSATNLLGADITALSDNAESVQGIVKRVSIDKGEPKLHVDLNSEIVPSSFDGDLEKGTYAYRVVWDNGAGKLFGLDFSDTQAITTTGKEGSDRSVLLRNLPLTPGPKHIYRTDASGTGDYRLVGILHDGKQSSFVDGLSKQARGQGPQLTEGFEQSLAKFRSYVVSLKNVSFIRPPAMAAPPVEEEPPVSQPRPDYAGDPRPAFNEPQRRQFTSSNRPAFET
jgi:Flagellar hook capping protein - N-terminal region